MRRSSARGTRWTGCVSSFLNLASRSLPHRGRRLTRSRTLPRLRRRRAPSSRPASRTRCSRRVTSSSTTRSSSSSARGPRRPRSSTSACAKPSRPSRPFPTTRRRGRRAASRSTRPSSRRGPTCSSAAGGPRTSSRRAAGRSCIGRRDLGTARYRFGRQGEQERTRGPRRGGCSSRSSCRTSTARLCSPTPRCVRFRSPRASSL